MTKLRTALILLVSVLFARDGAGAEQTFGAVLPGFGDFEARKRIRTYYAFERMFEGAPAVRDAYFDRIVAEFRESYLAFVNFGAPTEHEAM